MSIMYNWILGISLGFEIFDDDFGDKGVILDLGIIRLIFFVDN